jgi:hypothetical protein
MAGAVADQRVEAVGKVGDGVEVGTAGTGVFEPDAVVVAELAVGPHDPGGDTASGRNGAAAWVVRRRPGHLFAARLRRQLRGCTG